MGKENTNNLHYSRVKVVDHEHQFIVPITSSLKPQISPDIILKWQNTINIAAKILDIPASLIMKLEKDYIEVFLSSQSPGNPYKEGGKENLGLGLYCETVAGNRSELLVANALNDAEWKNNPDIKLNMISYYGLPILWPDGELFGTFCVLDNKENSYTQDHLNLLQLLKYGIELDLKLLLQNDELKQSNLGKELLMKEINHRVKNNFNMIISLIELELANENKTTSSLETIIKNIETRILSLSMVHEMLSRSNDLKNVDLKEYIIHFIDLIRSSFHEIEFTYTITSPHILLHVNFIIPCGMILNELITNSLKHAFLHTSDPQIHISITLPDPTTFRLEYIDNGRGLPNDFSITDEKSLGMILITVLTKQLEGEVTIQTGKQSKFMFTFPYLHGLDVSNFNNG